MTRRWWALAIGYSLAYGAVVMAASFGIGVWLGQTAQFVFIPLVLLGGIGFGVLLIKRGWVS